jgi:PBP1b-binding outer membrane lipoprotein LpoB
MRRLTALLALAFVVASCSPKEESTGSVNNCATDLFSSYNPKVLDQCVAVCKKCDHGITSTCSTSCTLKGAR